MSPTLLSISTLSKSALSKPALSKSAASVVLAAAGAVLSVVTQAAHADTASDVHAALKERWYQTELVVFRYTNPSQNETLLLTGDRISAQQELEAGTANNELDSTTAVNVLKLGGRNADEAAQNRPRLDAQPWDTLRQYATGDDLNEIVQRNLATWETQLRAIDRELLSTAELTLSAEAQRLNSGRNTELLVHTGWVQSVPPRDNGVALPINAGSPWVDSRTGAERSKLEGEVTVTLGRYLHVHPTLFYTPDYTPDFAPENQTGGRNSALSGQRGRNTTATGAAAADGRRPEVRDLSQSGGSALDRLRDAANAERDARESSRFPRQAARSEPELPPYIRLDQSRRVRSSELHYIDHPELGVLVRVTPVVPPAVLQEQFALLQ